MKVHVIDVDSGNIRSLQNAIQSLGYEVVLVRDLEEAAALETAEKVLLPGVGNFGHFMDQVHLKQLADPIKKYIASGRPIMGICVGLQALFEGSVESPSSKGLAVLKGTIGRFSSEAKSVPHIGWNGVKISTSTRLYSIDPTEKFYFVHSFARLMTEAQIKQELPGWDYAIGTYGDEQFVAALAKDNLFFTQFHPEKSGNAGLNVIKAFLTGSKLDDVKVDNSLSTGLSKRVIACLDVRTNDQGDIVVTKGDQYDVRDKGDEGAVRNLGKPVEVAEKYYQQGADEVTFLNIMSFRNSPLKDLPMLEVLRIASKSVFVPFTIGGGIRDTFDPASNEMVPALQVAHLYFRSGADKVSIGSDAVDSAEKFYKQGADGTSPIETISKAYGAQAVVVSVDPKRVYVSDPSETRHHTFKTKFPGPAGEQYVWYQCTTKGGREDRDLGAYELAQAVQQLGAGELLLNCIDKDGTNSGFDLELIRDIKSAVSIPVIASSGAGKPEHFDDVFEHTTADAALGAGMFHRNEYTVGQVKDCLRARGLVVR